jgi:iron complex transport system substrate-binding protein
MYKDVWYLPYGNSWQAKFISDANAKYVYGYTNGKGSISLAFEKVLDKAENSEYWLAPGSFSSYDAMLEASSHYNQFKAFQDNTIFSFASTTGETGGVLYYELGPNRPDLVLKDMVSILHPELLKDYTPTFFKPLN